MADRTRRRGTAGHHRRDLGLLAMRIGTGGVLFAHGAQKLLGWFGGSGLEGTTKDMEQMGFHPGRSSAIAAGVGEMGGGALLAVGLATPAAGAAAAGAMAAASSVHWPAGFFATAGGLEHPAHVGAAAAALGLAGPGRYSLDHLTGHRLNRPWVAGAAFTTAAVAAALVIRRRALDLRDQREGGSEEDSAAAAAD